jgi:hypothetical protein
MKTKCLLAMIGLMSLWVVSNGRTVELKPSPLELELHKVRFESTTAGLGGSHQILAATMNSQETDSSISKAKYKSPFKAFLLSAAIPGAGQFYNGSKIKAVAFLGVEVTSWVLHFKYKSDANQKTDEFNAYNDRYWSRDRYQSYLEKAYNKTDDEQITAREISHHLPETNTQQYYEMTGKYNQFAWGWDDAILGGLTLTDYSGMGGGNPLPAITGEASTIPSSAHRMIYEDMRYEANKLYDKADTWLVMTMVNRLVSGFEAYFSAKKHNGEVVESDPEFSNLDMKVSLKSIYAYRDTPYLKLSYKF